MRLLHRCDLFRVVQDQENHLTPATPYGVGVSIATAVLLLLLLVGEGHSYFSGHKNCHITPATFKNTLADDEKQQVDTIHFAITLPHIPCHRVATETVSAFGHDAAVEAQANIALYHVPFAAEDAATSTRYLEGELPREGERGCHVTGTTPLSPARASFNIIVRDYKPHESAKLRPNFAVNSFYVGHLYEDWGVPQIQRRTVQPLTNFKANYDLRIPYFFQFYLQLIQTTVDRPGKDDRFGYQYTAYYSVVQFNGYGRAPGLYFGYQPSSYSMDCAVTYDTVSHFMVHLCAVVGGVYTVASIIEAGLEWWARERRLRETSAQNTRNAETLLREGTAT